MTKNTYKLHSHENLTRYMKKFSSIEKSLLFEIDGDKIIAKTHTPDKSVVKIGSILITDIMDASQVEDDLSVKIGLFAVDNFVASFKHFGDSEVKLSIEDETIGDDRVATEMKAASKNLKISFPCASTSMFRYIDATLAEKIMNTEKALYSFRVEKDTLTKVSALSGLDNDHELISIESKDGEIKFKGKSFELNIPGVTTKEESQISFYKTHFGFVDKEDTEIFVTNKKIIFKSLETDTSIVIGKVE
jgi:hypothetical protein